MSNRKCIFLHSFGLEPFPYWFTFPFLESLKSRGKGKLSIKPALLLLFEFVGFQFVSWYVGMTSEDVCSLLFRKRIWMLTSLRWWFPKTKVFCLIQARSLCATIWCVFLWFFQMETKCAIRGAAEGFSRTHWWRKGNNYSNQWKFWL